MSKALKSRINVSTCLPESGSFHPWVVLPGRFALGRFALVFGVGRFAHIRWVVSPASRFALGHFAPIYYKAHTDIQIDNLILFVLLCIN